jgi:hypothetical protein
MVPFADRSNYAYHAEIIFEEQTRTHQNVKEANVALIALVTICMGAIGIKKVVDFDVQIFVATNVVITLKTARNCECFVAEVAKRDAFSRQKRICSGPSRQKRIFAIMQRIFGIQDKIFAHCEDCALACIARVAV